MAKEKRDSCRIRKGMREYKKNVQRGNVRFLRALTAIVKTNKHANIVHLADRIISFCEYVKMTEQFIWQDIVATTIFCFTRKRNTLDMMFGRNPRRRKCRAISPILSKMLEQKNAGEKKTSGTK